MRLIVAFAFVALVHEASAQTEEIVIADYLDWEGYPAFFVDAPASVADRMRMAIRESIKTGEINCIAMERVAWFCEDQQYRYFRGVTGTGRKTLSGLVCSGSEGVPKQKYYPESLLQQVSCIGLEWDGDERKYFVNVPSDA